MFLDDLKSYLTALNYTDIYRDTMPDLPEECIGLFMYLHKPSVPNDGGGCHYVQIQVRRKDGDDAAAIAAELFKLLDSGTDETPIILTEDRKCIVRPIKGPRKMTEIEHKGDTTTWYVEFAFGGKNDP